MDDLVILYFASGVDTTFLRFPRVEKAVDPKPTTVPTPIDS